MDNERDNLNNRLDNLLKWLMFTSLGTVLGIVSYANDLFDFKKNVDTLLNEDVVISGTFIPGATVSVNTKVKFEYSVPDSGYYTIWNQNREGILKKLWPIDNTVSSAISSGQNQHRIYPYPLLASTPHSNENIIILWSDNSNHPPKQVYPTWKEFQEYIDTHHYNWKKKAFSLQVQ